MLIMYKIRFMEPFKDGNIQEGRTFKAGEEVTLSEQDMQKIQQSGGVFDTVEKLIRNPLKPVEADKKVKSGEK